MTDAFDEPITVLHIDDDEDICQLTKEFLERQAEHLKVQTCYQPTGVLETLANEDIDCIVSDYNMPELNGIELLEKVRQTYPDLPFILYTGKGSEEVASDAISAGVTDYLQKETGSDQYTVLANRIENAVSQFRAQEELEETTKFYRTVLDHSSDYVMIVAADGEVSYISPAVRRVMGFTPEELMARDAFDFVHEEDLQDAASSLQKIIVDDDREYTVEFRAKHKDGSWRWLEVRGRNLIEDPVINGVMVNVRDITTRKEREQALEQQKERLEDLTSFLSHDVRNELSILDGTLTLAHDETDNDHLETAKTSVSRIDDMVGKIIELSQTGTLSTEPGPVYLQSLLETTRENLRPESIDLVMDTDFQLLADESRLQSLFDNLVLNAIEHGNAETVRIGALESADGFYVADDGTGLTVEDRSKIFDPDYTTSDEGSGLGLAIVESVAHTHGWEIEVSESEDGGVRFEFIGVDRPK